MEITHGKQPSNLLDLRPPVIQLIKVSEFIINKKGWGEFYIYV